MKKALVLLLLIVYGFSSMGATLNFQYCCGKLEKINFIPLKAKACCKAAMKKKMKENGCCNDKSFDLKIKDDQAAVSAYVFSSEHALIQHAGQTGYTFTNPVKIQTLLPEVYAPPPIQNNFLPYFCSFRI